MSASLSQLWSPSGLILIAAIIGAIAAYWAAAERSASDRESKRKSKEIAKLNERIAGLVTGGDSFCYFQISSPDMSTNAGMLMAVQHGSFPIYDVSARIVDLQLFEQKKATMTLKTLLADDINISVGSMPVGTASMISPFPLGAGATRRDFNIFFSARNGLYTELLRLRKLEQKWTSAIRVQMREGKDEKIVFEQIDPDFPKDELDWTR